MLSRVANSIYWMCRYIERAENVARFIDVNLNLQLDRPSLDDSQWSPLIMITGDQELYEKTEQAYTPEEVIWFLTFDRKYPSSIISCLSAARENARTIREVISTELWEHLNTFYLELITEEAIKLSLNDPHRFYRIIKMRSHLFTGLIDSTMSHGEAWNFARIGTMMERADKTSRILDVKYFMLLRQVDLVNTPVDSIQWIAVLKSASGFEVFRRVMHHVTPHNVANFLVFNQRFPRSVKHCLTTAQSCLHGINGTQPGQATNLAERSMGRLVADLEYTDIDEVIESGLHEFLDHLQTRLNEVDKVIGETFFNIAPPVTEQTSEQ